MNELPEMLHNHDPPIGSLFNTSCLSCGTVCCYADDSSFTVFHPNTQDLSRAVTEKYEIISDFMSNNRLKLNSDKTHLMLLATDRSWNNKVYEDSIQLNTGNESIGSSKSEKLLGGIVSRNLEWDDHIMHDPDSIIKKLSQRLSAIKQMSYFADFKTRKMVTNGLFISRLAYLMPLWGGCQKFQIRALQLMQNRAARYVTRNDVYTPAKTLLIQCGWLSVYQMIFYHTIVLFYKTKKYSAPTVLLNMSNAYYFYNTRAKSMGNYRVFSEIKTPSDIALRSYRWRSVQSWNILPYEIKSIKNDVQFKKSLKVWIMGNIDIYP